MSATDVPIGAPQPSRVAMKISVDIDCTPEEMRHFFGLPDVAPLQDKMMKEIERRMMENLKGMEPEALMKAWAPFGLEGIEKMQKAFWSQMAASPRKDPKG
jgi:hypothetical protein